jgi:hypothetical protein
MPMAGQSCRSECGNAAGLRDQVVSAPLKSAFFPDEDTVRRRLVSLLERAENSLVQNVNKVERGIAERTVGSPTGEKGGDRSSGQVIGERREGVQQKENDEGKFRDSDAVHHLPVTSTAELYQKQRVKIKVDGRLK